MPGDSPLETLSSTAWGKSAMHISRRKMLAISSTIGPAMLFSNPWIQGAEPETPEGDVGTIKPSDKPAAPFDEFTPESEESLRRANLWLMKAVHRDGGCGVDLGQQADIGCTAMVGLALLSQGNTPIEGPQSREVRNIVAYLLRTVDTMPSDDITSAARTQLQNKIGRHAHTFFATLFLSQVLGEGFDPIPVRRALTKLVDTLARAQTSEGNWGTDSWAPVLGTVVGWVALRGAHFAGFKVEASAKKTAEHLLQVMQNNIAQQNGSWMHTLYKNATGVRVIYAMGLEHEGIAEKAFNDVLEVIKKDNTPFSQAGGEEYLAFHLITETMLQRGGEDWARWYPVVRDKIMAVQNSDGSWAGKHCITSRTFCTAAASMVLSAPNRYLPISQQ
jgi:hypothetical protein